MLLNDLRRKIFLVGLKKTTTKVLFEIKAQIKSATFLSRLIETRNTVLCSHILKTFISKKLFGNDFQSFSFQNTYRPVFPRLALQFICFRLSLGNCGQLERDVAASVKSSTL